MKEITINKKKISEKTNKVYIIAEAGIGHFGSFKIAKKLVDLAKNSGADAVKFQAYITKDLIHKNFKNWYHRYAVKEVDFNFFLKLKNYCKKKKIEMLLTPHTESVLSWIKKLNLPAIKVGSGELGNFYFLNKIISLKKPIIVSTGMHESDDLIKLKNFFKKKKINNVIFLKCQSTYPSVDHDINFNNFKKFKKIFNGYFIGYSDHSKDDLAIIGSIFNNAKVIEKHISIKFNVKNAQDWKVSFDQKKMKNMVDKIRRIEKILGSENIFVSKKEKKSKVWATKSIFSKNKILKNSKINPNNVCLLRPGKGLKTNLYTKIMNLRVKKNIEPYTYIKQGDFKK